MRRRAKATAVSCVSVVDRSRAAAAAMAAAAMAATAMAAAAAAAAAKGTVASRLLTGFADTGAQREMKGQ